MPLGFVDLRRFKTVWNTKKINLSFVFLFSFENKPSFDKNINGIKVIEETFKEFPISYFLFVPLLLELNGIIKINKVTRIIKNIIKMRKGGNKQ